MTKNNKILTISGLEELSMKKTDNTVILCHGVFDLLHIGHIKYFEEAKSMGDILVVTLTPDKFVNKGSGRPVFNQQLRLEAISALECVDYVAINQWPTAIETIQIIKPDVYVKGPDYKNYRNDTTGLILDEIRMTKKFGGRIVYTKDITFSSSKTINSFNSTYSPKQKETFQKIKEKH